MNSANGGGGGGNGSKDRPPALLLAAAAAAAGTVAVAAAARRAARKRDEDARAVATIEASRFRAWPLSEVRALAPGLRAMGLRLSPEQVDGTSSSSNSAAAAGASNGGGGTAISDALVKVGGGTGSFVSRGGLIITNHHVAFDAVRQISTPEHDYVRHGFVARTRAEEIVGADYQAWITRSCTDVSAAVREAVGDVADPVERARKAKQVAHDIEKAKRATFGEGSGFSCRVVDMWPDRVSVLFVYERLLDVRIVYVPPLAVGNFGGDTDNYEWPRHTADFTIFRAYVGPDGRPAPPSKDNVPYEPSSYLRFAAHGAAEGDFVFLLGFPGRTQRWAPACRLAYDDEVTVPADLADFAAKLRMLKQHCAAPGTDRAVQLKGASAQKSLANYYKRYFGKQLMMRRLDLCGRRRREEAVLAAQSAAAAGKLAALARVYDQLRALSPTSEAYDRLTGYLFGSSLLYVGTFVVAGQRPAGAQRDTLRNALAKKLKDLHVPLEADLVRYACRAACAQCADMRGPVDAFLGMECNATADDAAVLAAAQRKVEASLLRRFTEQEIEDVLAGRQKPPPEDPFVQLASALARGRHQHRAKEAALTAHRDALLAQWLELSGASDSYVPDANGTLRFSVGFVEGYSPADAVYHAPSTTLRGLLAKHEEAMLPAADAGTADRAHFDLPDRLVDTLRRSDDAALRTPVNFICSCDTVGGNSGSPVLNSCGEFVGINFDRPKEGLLNEYAWSKEFSRSVAVDSRYILWLIGTYDDAPHLVAELLGSPPRQTQPGGRTVGRTAIRRKQVSPPLLGVRGVGRVC